MKEHPASGRSQAEECADVILLAAFVSYVMHASSEFIEAGIITAFLLLIGGRLWRWRWRKKP